LPAPHRLEAFGNAYMERIIGSIRRECLDYMIILNAAHLHRVLKAYAEYYNSARTHLSLDKTRHFEGPLSHPASFDALGRFAL